MRKLPFNIKLIDGLINSYFESHIAKHPEVVPDIESLAAFLGITRDELTELENNKKYGIYVKLAKTRIAATKKQLAYRGKIPVTLLQFDLRNDHGYRDKPDDSAYGVVILKGDASKWGE